MLKWCRPFTLKYLAQITFVSKYIQIFVLVSCEQMLLLEHIIPFITFPFGINVMLYMSCQVLRPFEGLFAGAMETLVHPRLVMNVYVLM